MNDEIDKAAEVVAYLEDEGFDFDYDGQGYLAKGSRPEGGYRVTVQPDGEILVTANVDSTRFIEKVLQAGDVTGENSVNRYTFSIDMAENNREDVIKTYRAIDNALG
jgi:hypothetical protein